MARSARRGASGRAHEAVGGRGAIARSPDHLSHAEAGPLRSGVRGHAGRLGSAIRETVALGRATVCAGQFARWCTLDGQPARRRMRRGRARPRQTEVGAKGMAPLGYSAPSATGGRNAMTPRVHRRQHRTCARETCAARSPCPPACSCSGRRQRDESFEASWPTGATRALHRRLGWWRIRPGRRGRMVRSRRISATARGTRTCLAARSTSSSLGRLGHRVRHRRPTWAHEDAHYGPRDAMPPSCTPPTTSSRRPDRRSPESPTSPRWTP